MNWQTAQGVSLTLLTHLCLKVFLVSNEVNYSISTQPVAQVQAGAALVSLQQQRVRDLSSSQATVMQRLQGASCPDLYIATIIQLHHPVLLQDVGSFRLLQITCAFGPST